MAQAPDRASEIELARFGLCHHAVEIPAGVERKCSAGRVSVGWWGATIAVLDRLEELFADGERWIQGDCSRALACFAPSGGPLLFLMRTK